MQKKKYRKNYVLFNSVKERAVKKYLRNVLKTGQIISQLSEKPA